MGVSNETRKDLLGYIRADVTTLYSQVEVIELWRSLDLLCSDGTSADILRFPAKSPQKFAKNCVSPVLQVKTSTPGRIKTFAELF